MGDKTELAQLITVICKSSGLKDHHFADKVGISPATLTSLANGRRRPSAATAMRLAEEARDTEARRKILEHAGISRERIRVWFPELAAREKPRNDTALTRWAHVTLAHVFEHARNSDLQKMLGTLELIGRRYGASEKPKPEGS